MANRTLHMFIIDVDLVVAADLDDAWDVWSQSTGTELGEEPRQILAVLDHFVVGTKTAGEWASIAGRGVVASFGGD